MKTAQEILKVEIKLVQKNQLSPKIKIGMNRLHNELRQNAIAEIKECENLTEHTEDSFCKGLDFEDKCLACQDKIRFWEIKEEELK